MNEQIVENENKLTVGIGWDAKEVDLKGKLKIAIDDILSATSENTYDLNIAAIIEHTDGTKPELVFWGHKYSRDGSVAIKGLDDRIGKKDGIDQEMRIYLDKCGSVSRIILCVFIYNGNLHKQCLAEVNNVFAVIKGKHTEKVYVRADSVFKDDPAAKENNCYYFGEVINEDGKWVVREKSQFLPLDKSEFIYEHYTQTHYVPED